jgi:hypothetical protein
MKHTVQVKILLGLVAIPTSNNIPTSIAELTLIKPITKTSSARYVFCTSTIYNSNHEISKQLSKNKIEITGGNKKNRNLFRPGYFYV